MQPHPKKSLIEQFATLADPRVNRTKEHPLVNVLIIGVCTLLCGGETFNDMEDFGEAKRDWFASFLDLSHGIPSHDTFNRVFSAIDPREFLQAFVNWTQSVRQAVPDEIVAMDGKALRRALAKDQNARVIVSAWAEDNGLVLGQLKVDDKSNEITAVPPLLRALELSGCIVTLDAMGCQREIAREIKEADAEYVLALKGNQETLHREVREFLDAAVAESKSWKPPGAPSSALVEKLAGRKTVEKDHGRIETREYYQSAHLGWPAWPGGRACKRWAWWRRRARSMERSAGSGAITYRVCRWMWSGLPGRCGATGELKTSSTGCWTFNSARTEAGRAAAMRPRTSPPCAALP